MTAKPSEPSRLKVCVVSDAAPERNGVGTYYSDLSQRLASHASVLMISPTVENGRWGGGLRLPLPGDSTQRVCLPRPGSLAQKMAAHRPDTVIIATPGPYGLLGMRAAKHQGARVIIGFHTHFEKVTHLYWRWAMGWITRRYFAWSHGVLFRHGEVVLANSPAMMAEARRLGAHNVALIGTPLHREFLDTPVTPPRPEFTDVLFAGRLSAEKNIFTVLAAAEALPHIHVHIAGDGPLRAEIEAACRRLPNAHYLGWLSRERLRATLDRVDALVLPSHVESFGTVALEAMARGRLVIASASCGICEWPELSDALMVMEKNESVSAVIRRVMALSAAERHDRARRARQAAVTLNRENLSHWVRLIKQEHPGDD